MRSLTKTALFISSIILVSACEEKSYYSDEDYISLSVHKPNVSNPFAVLEEAIGYEYVGMIDGNNLTVTQSEWVLLSSDEKPSDRQPFIIKNDSQDSFCILTPKSNIIQTQGSYSAKTADKHYFYEFGLFTKNDNVRFINLYLSSESDGFFFENESFTFKKLSCPGISK